MSIKEMTLSELMNDIDNALESFQEYHEPASLDEALIGILSILNNVCVGMEIKKYIYPELIRQLIATSKSAPSHYADYYKSERSDDELRAQVEYLRGLPQASQRSPEWYRQRQCTLGASETATIFGLGGFGTERSLLRKKLGLSTDDYKSNKYTEHGVKYEPIIQQVYKIRENCRELYEFGSLIHPTYNFISASPDGITDSGRMLEIKAPYARGIMGIPPPYYWSQMQQQMEVCNLEAVDYIECQIEEMEGRQWLESGTPEGLHRNIDGHYRGVVRQSADGRYEYTELDAIRTMDDYKNWTSPSAKYFHWTMKIYSKFTVLRNRTWWNNNVVSLEKFWQKLEEYRNKPKAECEVLLADPVKKPRITPESSKPSIVFDFVDD